LKKHLSILFLFLSITFSFAQINIAQGGASTSTNTDGVTGSGNSATINQYTAKGIKIEWKENANGQFAYDTAEKTKLPKDKYLGDANWKNFLQPKTQQGVILKK